MDETFSCDTAAKYCNCGTQTIRDSIRKGELVAAKIGKGYVITKKNLDEFISNKEKLTAQAVQQKDLKCYSSTATGYGTSIFARNAVKGLDALLEQRTRN